MKQQSIKKNFIYTTFYRVLNIITPIITAPYAARIFGASGIGIQSYVNSIVAYFILFAALGTATYGQREIAMCRDDKKKASKTFWEIEILSVITTSVCLIGWFVMICLTTRYKIYYLILTISIIAVAFDITWFFSGHEKFKIIVIRNTIIKLIGIAILFIFVKQKNDLLLYMGLIAATGFLGNLSLWTVLPKYLTKVKIKNIHFKKHLKETLVYFIPTIATSVYTILDKTMLGLITRSENENGYYEQASKIINMAVTVVTSLNAVMLARMSYLYAEKKLDEIKDRLKKSISFTMFMCIPIVVGIIGIAQNFVPWFFGNGYDKVVILLYAYSPIIIIIAISNCLGYQYLTPSGQRARSSKGIIIGAVVNLGCNAIMIPFLKSMGAVIASLIAESVITIIYVYMCDEYMTWRIIFKNTWKRVIACIPMFVVICCIGLIHINPIIMTLLQVVCGAIFYFVVLLILKDDIAKEIIELYIVKYIKKIIKK